MNYYRRYMADFKAKTGANSMMEDGAYNRLLDWYYENEKALPLIAARIYAIACATTPAERKAVDHVLDVYFEKRTDGYHNKRADEELAEALPKLANLRAVARVNGAKGGRKKADATYPQPKPEPDRVPDPEPNPGPDLVATSQNSEKPNTAFPVVTTSGVLPAESGVQDTPAPDGRRRGFMGLLRKSRVMGIDEHPLIVDRILATAKDPQIVFAMNDAARSKGGAPYDVGYLDAVIARVVKADREADERMHAGAQAKHDATQAQLAEQRTWKAAPKPDNLPKLRRTA